MRVSDRILGALAAAHAGGVRRSFLRSARRATNTQADFLNRLLLDRRQTRFGREHGFLAITDYAAFARQVPIRDYDGHAPYIDAVRRGEVNALFPSGQRILMFAMTSGTTAQPKYIPITPAVLAASREAWNVWGVQAILDHPGTIVRPIVQVTSPMDDHYTPADVPCGAITGLLAENQKKLVRRFYTSPPCVAQIRDPLSKYYTIMRLAVPRDVAWLVTANPQTLLILARVANEQRDVLIRDVYDGTLGEQFEVPDRVRAELKPRLQCDPAKAKFLEACSAQHGGLFPKDYWNLGFRAHWLGGTMGLFESQFAEHYGSVPARDIGLIASEGRMSIPVADGTASGVLAIRNQFFEFIPENEHGSQRPTTLRSHEVKVGEVYYLLLTNGSGLYRYDVGDRVRVTGWLGQAPTIEFLSRGAHACSLAGEKLTEDQVVLAMRKAVAGLPTVDTFVLAPRFAGTPHYRLYVDESVAERLPRIASMLDAALCDVSSEYASKRKTMRLNAIELMSLPAGFLSQRDRSLRAKRAHTAEQFKHQYLLPRPGLDDDLGSSATAFSVAG